MSAFEVGQVLYWVNSQGQERSGTVVGFEDGDVRVDVSDADGPMTLPMSPVLIHSTRLAAWETFRDVEVIPHLAYVAQQHHHWEQLYAKSFTRIATLRGGAEVLAHRAVGDGSFQGGTDADREAL